MTGSFSALMSGSLVADGPDFWGRIMISHHNLGNKKEEKRKHFTFCIHLSFTFGDAICHTFCSLFFVFFFFYFFLNIK